MKRVYWRPSGVSRSIHLILAICSIAGITSVEVFRTTLKQKMYQEKTAAARTMQKAIQFLGAKRIEISGEIDLQSDPTGSGLIGVLMSEITSTSGHLQAKQTSINPNWAAVVVEYLRRAKLKRGDTIAVGFSGSFPALNLATIIAAETMGLRVLLTTGLTASMWGANVPEFTWLDMERFLIEGKQISTKSLASSFGGQGDRAHGISTRGRQLIKAAILRNHVKIIEAPSPEQSLESRMEIYERAAQGEKIKAYINVGGNTISVGSSIGKKLYREGINLRPSASALSVDCVMSRFARKGLPVIHLIRIHKLAERHGLPVSPSVLPKVGEGLVFAKEEYNLYLASAVLLFILVLLFVFMKSDLGFRIMYIAEELKTDAQPPSPMV